MYSVRYLENLTGSSYNGQSNTSQTERRIRVIAKDYPSRIVWSGFQDLTTQRITVRLGSYSAGTVRDLA